MKWTDGEIDKLYQERSENLSFEYKDEYWQELSASMPYSESGESEFDRTDSEIDVLYQTKAKTLSFAYKSQYWKEMAAMLPERRKRDLIWYFTSYVFIGLLVMTPFVGSNDTVQNGVIAEVDHSSIHTAPKNTNSTDVKGQENVQISDGNSAIKNNTNTKVEQEYHNTTASTQNTQNKRTSDSNATPMADFQVPNDDLNNSAGVIGNDSDDSDEIRAERTESELTSGDKSVEATSNTIDPIEVIAASQAGTNNVEDERNDIGDLSVKPLGGNEFANNIIPLTGYTLADIKMPTRTNLYVELNGGISQSLISPSENISYALGVGVGAQIQKGKFTFITGLNGLMSNHEDLELSRQAKVYGFGSETFSYELKYKQIYSLEAVLSIGYQMGKHTLSIGCRPSYVVGSKVAYDSGAKDGAERQVLYGYMDGIKRFGIKPMLGYSVNLTPNLMLGVNVGMKLTPSVNEDFINGVNNKLPVDGQIFLRKSLSFRR